MPALSYRDVLERYDRARAFGDTRSLPEYAQGLNDLYNTQDFGAGLRDGPWTRFSTRADEALGATVTPITGFAGSALGNIFGNAAAGQRVGEGLPRALMQSLPLYLAGPGAGVPATVAALGTTGALFGSQTYADTGSAKAALISGGTAAALPAIGGFAGNIGARAFGGTKLAGELGGRAFNQVLPETANDAFKVAAGRFLGSQTAQIGTQLASQIAQNRTMGGNEGFGEALTSPEFWLNQIPFTVYDAVHAARTNVPTAEQIRPQLTQPERVKPTAPYTPPTPTDEQQAQMDTLLNQFETVHNDPLATGEQRAAALKALTDNMANPPTEPTQAVTQLARPTTDDPVKLTGRVSKVGDSYRVLVDDIQTPYQTSVTPGSTVFVNNAEPTYNPETNRMEFNTSIKNLRPARNGLSETDFGVQPTALANPEQPDLAHQPLEVQGEQVAQRAEQGLQQVDAASQARRAKFAITPYSVPDTQLTSPEVQTMKDMGVTEPNIARVVQETPYGTNNKVFTADRAEAARQRIRDRLKQVGTGIDPTVLLDVIELGGYHIEAGVREFGAWAGRMKDELGNIGDEYLKDAWVHLQKTSPIWDTPKTTIPQIKQAAVTFEQAQQRETDARTKTTAIPTKAEEWANHVDPVNGKAQIEQHLSNGATPTQAVESTRLQTQTLIVDDSVAEQNVQHDIVHQTISEGKFGEQGQFGGAILDEQGNRRRWRNPAQAETYFRDVYLKEHPEEERTFKARNDNRGFYYLAPKENTKVQFDTGAEGEGGLEKVLEDKNADRIDADALAEANEPNLGKENADNEIAATPIENRPDVSRQSVLQMLDVADRNPKTFAEFVDPDIIEDSPKNLVAKARITLQVGPEGLAAVNEALKARGIAPFKNEREMSTQMRELMKGASLFVDRYRNVALGSLVPGDIGALPPGTLDSVQKLAEHIATRKELGPIADLIGGVARSGILPKNTEMGLPGVEDHDPLGFWMQKSISDILPSRLNIPSFPENINDTAWYRQAAHELIHLSEDQLSSRDDPAAMEYKTQRDAVLEALRNSKAVPQKARATATKLIKSNVYDAVVSSKMTPDELRAQISSGIGKENKEYFSYVYAMLHPQEMIATLFSDPKLIAIADTTPMKQGFVDSALTFLSKAFNRLIGGEPKTETALSSMLKSYDNYLTGGIMRKVYNGANFVRDSLVAKGVRPDALASRMQTVDRTFARGTLDASVAGFQREQTAGLLPTTSSEGVLAPTVLDALRSPEAAAPYDATMSLLAADLPMHQDLLWRMSQDVDITSALVKAVKAGEVPGSLPPNVEKNLDLSRAKVNSMRKAMQKQSLALARWNKLDNFDPEGWERSIAAGLTERVRNIEPPDEVPDAAEVRKLMGLQRLAGGGMNWLAKTFMLTPHLKELIPESKPVFAGVNDEQGKAHARAVMLNGAYVYDPATQNLSTDIKKSNERVAASDPLTQAASTLFLYQNKEGGSQALDFKDPTVAKTLARFNPTDQKAILQLLTSQWQRHHVWADNVLPPALGQINRDNTGILIAARETGMLPQQARDISTQVYDGLSAASSQDPGQAQVGAAQLRALASKMQPDTFFAALKHAQTLSETTANWIKRIRDNPGYTSEQRYGDDRLRMTAPNGDSFYADGSREKLQRIQAEKASQGYEFLDYISKEDKANPSFGMREDTLNALDQLDGQNEQIVAQLLQDQPDLAARILPRIQRAGDIRANLAAQGPLPAVKRKFVQGREYLNMVDNANQFYTRMNNWLRNRSTRARTNLDMMHPQIEGNTELQNLLNTHVQNFLTPDNPMARKLVEATYFYKLAFDLGNTALEATQNLTTGMSGLIGETGSVTDAIGLWTKAVKDISTHFVTKKWGDDDTTWMINRASDEGHMGRPSWSDIVDPDTAAVSHANGGGVLNAVRDTAMGFASRFTGFNDTIALLSAYRLGREQGMSQDDAFHFAVDVKQRALFTGGKQQRPVGLWSIKTKPVPQLLGALQTYSLGWFSQMAENYTKGFGKAPEGLTSTQRLGAKKAFIYSLMAQGALAGALGLPGVGQGLALLGQATDTDPKGWLRQNLAKLFDEDQASGGVLTSLALRGVGSAGLPYDPSSRASVSVPFLGVDAYKGFDVANLGGAATSTVSDFAKGLLGLMHGDTTAAASLLPNVAKRPYQLWQGDGDIRDARGGLQVQLSPAERFAMAVGITPSRVQTERDTAEALKKANLAAERQQASFVDNLAEMMRQGKQSEVQQLLIQYTKQHPDANAKSLVQAVAARVEAQTMPYDWRRDLSPGVSLAGLTSAQPSNELARRQLRSQTEQSLGIYPSVNPAEDYRSALMDHLMDSNPLLSRPDARRAVSGKSPTPPPYAWLGN